MWRSGCISQDTYLLYIYQYFVVCEQYLEFLFYNRSKMTFLWYCILLQHLFCFCQLWLFQALVIIKFNQRNHISACSPSTSTIKAFQNLFSVKPFHNLLGHCSVVRDFFISKKMDFENVDFQFSFAHSWFSCWSHIQWPFGEAFVFNKYHFIIFKYTNINKY